MAASHALTVWHRYALADDRGRQKERRVLESRLAQWSPLAVHRTVLNRERLSRIIASLRMITIILGAIISQWSKFIQALHLQCRVITSRKYHCCDIRTMVVGLGGRE